MRTTNPSALVAANHQRLMASEVDQNFGQFAYKLPAGATMSFFRTAAGAI